MLQAIKEQVTVKKGGLIELSLHPELPVGTQAEVFIVLKEIKKKPVSLISFIGKGKGCFKTAEEVDNYIRKERDSWEL